MNNVTDCEKLGCTSWCLSEGQKPADFLHLTSVGGTDQHPWIKKVSDVQGRRYQASLPGLTYGNCV